MPITGLHHVHLAAPAGREAQARTFYGDALGLDELTPATPTPDTVWFRCGEIALRVGGGPAEQAAHSIAFRVADLDALQAALADHGITGELLSTAGDPARRLRCADGLGNQVELVELAGAAHAPLLGQAVAAADYAAGDTDVERVAVSPDGQWLAVGTSGENGPAAIYLWKLGQPGEPEFEIEAASSVWELAFSPSGRELVSLTEDGSLETWRVGDFESDQFAEVPGGSTGLVYSAEGGLLAVGAGNKVEVYRPGLDHLATVRPGLGDINALAFSPDGTLAVSAQAERIQLWQIRPAQLSSWEVIGHAAPALQLKAHPHQNVLAAITDSDQVLVWDVDQNPETPVDLTGDLSNVNALAFSPDGSLLAAGDEHGQIRLWDWHAGAVALEIAAELPVLALAFSPDGAQLLVGHEAGRVRAWKIK